MMNEWGVPSIYLHSMAYELCERLASRGKWVPDIAFAGGFSSEDHVFKALALGAPYCKAVCMGRALMIPGMVGKNAEKWLRGEDKGLPTSVSKYGSTKEEIFMNYEVLKEKYGSEVDTMPLGAIGIFSAVDKIKVGLQQLMAGARSWESWLHQQEGSHVSHRGMRQGHWNSLCHGGLSRGGASNTRRLVARFTIPRGKYRHPSYPRPAEG